MNTKDNTWEVGSVADRIKGAQKELRLQKRPFSGLRVIDFCGDAYVFPKGDKHKKTVIENVGKNPPNAFRVFTNPNDEIVIQEIKKLPFYHLV